MINNTALAENVRYEISGATGAPHLTRVSGMTRLIMDAAQVSDALGTFLESNDRLQKVKENAGPQPQRNVSETRWDTVEFDGRRIAGSESSNSTVPLYITTRTINKDSIHH